MKLQIFKIDNAPEEGPHWEVWQRQRLPKGSDNQYQTVLVGSGWTEETPQGRNYISLKVEGISDCAPKREK